MLGKQEKGTSSCKGTKGTLRGFPIGFTVKHQNVPGDLETSGTSSQEAQGQALKDCETGWVLF